MPRKILIIGTGFAGVWSALSAQRLIKLENRQNEVEVEVVAPQPSLTIRPRLYEADAAGMAQPVEDLFTAAGIKFLQGTVESIHTNLQSIQVRLPSGIDQEVPYDRLILAAGSSLNRPHQVTGIDKHTFDIDSLQSATKLDEHLKSLSKLPSSNMRDTIVVCGGGFSGIELATELPGRLNHGVAARIIIVEAEDVIGPELGPGPRSVITKALATLKVTVKLGSRIESVNDHEVVLTSGERIETMTPIWTAGMKATPLTEQIPGTRDSLSRVHVDQNLRVPSENHVFVTGDAARVHADDKGHVALMSCQHALVLGRFSGYNAAADLLGKPLIPYAQPAYNCCLDLGGYGAVIGAGWDRDVVMTGRVAKRVKQFINQKLIYTPMDSEEALVSANPIGPDSDELFRNMVQLVTGKTSLIGFVYRVVSFFKF